MVARYKDKPDMLPIVVRTCYDGDQFAEMVFYRSRIVMSQVETMERLARKQTDKESLAGFALSAKKDSFISNEEVDLPEEELAILNQ